MKKLILALALASLAACSGETGAEPEATATAAADAAATASKSPAAEEPPMTAERCIEENKGMGTGTRGEMTKECMIGACDKGDEKACRIVKSFSPEDANAPPEEEPIEE